MPSIIVCMGAAKSVVSGGQREKDKIGQQVGDLTKKRYNPL